MASRAAVLATRFLTSIRITGPLRPPTQSAHIRSIVSYNGLMGASKIQPVEDLMNPEERNTTLGFFGEALEKWQNEAELMREIRLLPEDQDLMARIQQFSNDQAMDLLDAIESETMDIRQGWIITANY